MATPTGATSAAVAAFTSGKDPISAGLAATGTQTTDPTNANRDDFGDAGDLDDLGNDSLSNLDATDPDEPAIDADAQAEDETDADDDASDDEADDSEESASDVEEVTVGGKKLKIDWSDKAGIKKQLEQRGAFEKGMRKFQAERDANAKELAAALKLLEPAKGKAADFDKLAAAWEADKIDGLVKLLTGGKQTFDDLVAERNAHAEWKKNASPAEVKAYEREQAAEKKAADAEKSQRDHQQKLQELTDKEERAEKATVQSYMDDAFTKVRFAGKLGDAAREHQIDKMIWSSARDELLSLPDDVEITPQMIQKEFARQAKALRGTIQTGVRKGTTEVLAQKKTEAKEQAQMQMKQGGSRTSTAEQDFKKDIAKGDFVSGFTRFLTSSKKK